MSDEADLGEGRGRFLVRTLSGDISRNQRRWEIRLAQVVIDRYFRKTSFRGKGAGRFRIGCDICAKPVLGAEAPIDGWYCGRWYRINARASTRDGAVRLLRYAIC